MPNIDELSGHYYPFSSEKDVDNYYKKMVGGKFSICLEQEKAVGVDRWGFYSGLYTVNCYEKLAKLMEVSDKEVEYYSKLRNTMSAD